MTLSISSVCITDKFLEKWLNKLQPDFFYLYLHTEQIVQEEKWNLEEDEVSIHGRSDIESQDYPPSGANHSHEPRTPGRP